MLLVLTFMLLLEFLVNLKNSAGIKKTPTHQARTCLSLPLGDIHLFLELSQFLISNQECVFMFLLLFQLPVIA